jgi:hypothetical protein
MGPEKPDCLSPLPWFLGHYSSRFFGFTFSFWPALTLRSYGYILFYAWVLRLSPHELPVAAPACVQDFRLVDGGQQKQQQRRERPGKRRIVGQGSVHDNHDPKFPIKIDWKLYRMYQQNREHARMQWLIGGSGVADCGFEGGARGVLGI